MITIRLQKISDAKRFFEILKNPNFIYWDIRPKTIKDEEKWLRKNPERRRKNSEFNYSIIHIGEIVGAVGVKINSGRPHIGEIGYFLDEKYWGQGITTTAVKLLETICLKKLKLKRLEIVMQPGNKASEKVAIKCGYKKEGLLKKLLKHQDGKYHDSYMYAKTI
ncbi:MAG: GNAT family N-acetyltransferase [Patescibacteria group bacterium]